MVEVVEKNISSAEEKKQKFLENLSGKQATQKKEWKAIHDQGQILLENNNFPISKTEAWKYTRVGKILNQSFSFSPSENYFDTSKYFIPGIEGNKLVFVNGFFRDDLSRIEGKGLKIGELTNGISENDFPIANNVFMGLNQNFLTAGISIHISANNRIEKPIQLLFLTDGEKIMSQPQLKIVAEKGSSSEFIQINQSNDEVVGFHNGATHTEIQDNASVKWDKIQLNGSHQFHLEQDFVQQAKDSRYSINTYTLSGAWTRNEVNIKVAGTNCETHLYGSYILKGNQHLDNHTVVDHTTPHCESNELYKGVLYDKAVGVFNGKVFVRPDAQKTNAFQSNGNILMSDDASMNSKPELEIYADDVKCSHGSTTGQMDEEAIFYLRSRGYPENKARQAMVSAFIGEVVEHAHRDETKNYVIEKLRAMNAWSN